HVVPRWVGDTNFMPVIGHTKVMVDGLLDTYDKLKIKFDKLIK
ncbi:MAG: HIT family hydrolase, partial [Deltaproteobacteria bacterium]|nr:HIT family hydrolase [Deltaproteobacteria bacterium]